MAMELAERASGIVEVRVTGKLSEEEYSHFVPELERLIKQHGKVSDLFQMQDLHGCDNGALWEDFGFDIRHVFDPEIEQPAMVGEKTRQKGITFCRPFTRAKIRYFDQAWIIGMH